MPTDSVGVVDNKYLDFVSQNAVLQRFLPAGCAQTNIYSLQNIPTSTIPKIDEF